jgi:hypothetical protein
MSEIKVVAVVKFNDGEALVLNRPLNFLYEFSGRDLVGSDGPFQNVYRYELPSGRFKAFAGREFDIPLKDGGSVRANGQYWGAHLSGMISATYGTVEQLVKCYVFTGGACIEPAAYAELRGAYTGCVYPYWDYEKIIKYDGERRYWIDKSFKLERDKRHLVAAVKAAHDQLRAALSNSEIAA